MECGVNREILQLTPQFAVRFVLRSLEQSYLQQRVFCLSVSSRLQSSTNFYVFYTKTLRHCITFNTIQNRLFKLMMSKNCNTAVITWGCFTANNLISSDELISDERFSGKKIFRWHPRFV